MNKITINLQNFAELSGLHWFIMSTGNLTARLRSDGGSKWTISSRSCLLWSQPVSTWLESSTSSLCWGRLCSTWKPSKVTLKNTKYSESLQSVSNVLLLVHQPGQAAAPLQTPHTSLPSCLMMNSGTFCSRWEHSYNSCLSICSLYLLIWIFSLSGCRWFPVSC